MFNSKMHYTQINKCQKCKKRISENIHHIDRNRKNNNRKNLLFLCGPCHMLLHKEIRKKALYQGKLWDLT